MAKENRLSISQEKYLQAIYHITVQYKVARTKKISEYLHVRPASVTKALRLLCKKGFINYEPHRFITLTPKGKKKAEDIIRRQDLLKNFLTSTLGVAPPEAEQTAFKLVHTIPDELFDLINRRLDMPVCGHSPRIDYSQYHNKQNNKISAGLRNAI